jgi:putative SOS response-associated peptidase YedK
MRWGLIPRWAKDPSIGNRMINARAETVASKPAFREAFQGRRCLLPADGFYEWKRCGARKQPMYLRMLDGRPFAFAGLWARWRPEGGEPVESCTILTTEPNELVADIHKRMPVILPPQDYGPWLDPETRDPARLSGMLQPYSAEEMIAYPVSTRVNRPEHDDPDCVEPVEAPDTGPGSLFD